MPSDPPAADRRPWWKGAVVYQIYPRSFADSGGDGVGDLEGIRRHLDHLSWLGVDAIWLSPFYRSPMDDFGYDVSDHCDVDPLFGTLEDFDRLVTDCHERDIRVIVDWVPNHTSDRHPWFEAARSSRDDPHRDWYVWRDPTPDGAPPNNWVATFSDGAPAWTLDEATGQWYLHLFLPSQPDVRWDHPELEEAMHDVLRFWLDRGVDGIRADVLHAIGKDPALPDDADDLLPIPHSALNHVPEVTLPRLRKLRDLLDSYPGDRMMVGEVYLLDTSLVAQYYDDGRGLHLSFNFPPLFAPWDAGAWRARVDRGGGAHRPRGLAQLGALQPRQPPPPDPLRGLRGPGPRRRLPGARPPGHPVPLRRRGAGPQRRRHPRRPGGRPRRPGRVPGPDPVDGRAPTTAGASRTRGCPGRRRPTAGTPPPSATTRPRSSTSTAGSSRPGRRRRPSPSATSSSSPRPDGVLAWERDRRRRPTGRGRLLLRRARDRRPGPRAGRSRWPPTARARASPSRASSDPTRR